eukprot:Sspe_Gene.115086::Locus_101980_Transcript_1_1_Confidence_1.000_Length_753::g.115086::m.115086
MGPFIESFPVGPLSCNCTIVGDTETGDAVVVDPGGNVDKIIRKLEDAKLKCNRVLVTHGHLDHILGAEEIKRRTGAVILLNKEDLFLWNRVEAQCADFGVPGLTKALKDPDGWIHDGDVIQWAPNLTVKCLHTPGHTPGSTSYYFEQHAVCCSGDTLFKGSIGRTEWRGIPSLEGTSNQQQELKSIKDKLFSLPEETVVVAGHGPQTSIGREKSSNMMLRGF